MKEETTWQTIDLSKARTSPSAEVVHKAQQLSSDDGAVKMQSMTINGTVHSKGTAYSVQTFLWTDPTSGLLRIRYSTCDCLYGQYSADDVRCSHAVAFETLIEGRLPMTVGRDQ